MFNPFRIVKYWSSPFCWVIAFPRGAVHHEKVKDYGKLLLRTEGSKGESKLKE